MLYYHLYENRLIYFFQILLQTFLNNVANPNPKTIDINIHPTKTEIKFEEEQSVYAILRSAVKHSLGVFQVVPTLDFEQNTALDVPYAFKEKIPTPIMIEDNK